LYIRFLSYLTFYPPKKVSPPLIRVEKKFRPHSPQRVCGSGSTTLLISITQVLRSQKYSYLVDPRPLPVRVKAKSRRTRPASRQRRTQRSASASSPTWTARPTRPPPLLGTFSQVLSCCCYGRAKRAVRRPGPSLTRTDGRPGGLPRMRTWRPCNFSGESRAVWPNS
jgi:hypothetical protein